MAVASSTVLLAGMGTGTGTGSGGGSSWSRTRCSSAKMMMALTKRDEDQSTGASSRRRLEEWWRADDIAGIGDRDPLPLPLPPQSAANNNPLARLHRLGCDWLGVIIEWEGVLLLDAAPGDDDKATWSWWALAQEEGRRPPPAALLRRARGMKSEQAMSELLCWSRDPLQLRRMARRREELLLKREQELPPPPLRPSTRGFLALLKRYGLPVAVASARPRSYLERGVHSAGLQLSLHFDELVSADDVQRGKPDPEMFVYAAARLGRTPDRCLVLGSSNASIEAAHEACMKCVAVAHTQPLYELSAADLVVRELTELSIMDIKRLAAIDLTPEFQVTEPEPELEPETEVPKPKAGYYY